MVNNILELEFTLTDLPRIAQTLLSYIHQHKIIAFHGEMGAGKTTLIKAICKIINIQENVNSPTFSIINEYKSQYGSIFHMDWYRLKDAEEAYNVGIEEIIDSGNICLIEWPERAPQLLPNTTLNIYLSVISENKRKLVCSF